MDVLGYIQQNSDLDNVYLTDEEMPEVFEGLGRLARRDPRTLRAHLPNVRFVPKGRGVQLVHRVPETKNMTGKALFERRLHLLPKNIREALYEARLQVVDYAVYGVEEGKDRNAFDVIYSSQTKKLGVSNISNGKLPQDRWFLLMSIIVQEATWNETTKKYSDWKNVDGDNRNGEWSMKVGGKPIFDEMPLEIFEKNGDGKITGEIRLENPKLIPPQTEIIFSLDLPANTKSKFRVILKGVATV